MQPEDALLIVVVLMAVLVILALLFPDKKHREAWDRNHPQRYEAVEWTPWWRE